MGDEKQLWLVGIGASAGGLEALTAFVSALPDESNACYIVAQHLAPHAKSMMVELIGRHSPINVDVVVNDMEIVPNRLLIVPPNFDVDVKRGRLILTKAGEQTRPKPSVDRFFKSLADSAGTHAVGIILSGTGSDGAEGIKAIKASGGVTMAQEEATAKFSGMPNSAFETGQVDIVLSPAEIARKLSEIVEGEAPYRGFLDQDETSPAFQQIIGLIRTEVGSDFSQYKIGTIKRRLSKRMAVAGAEDLAVYLGILQNDSKELLALSQEFLVSVTSFFRDPDAFMALSTHLKKILESKRPDEELRIWSAGSATGEEAYSLAMLASELAGETKSQALIKVFATDLDTDAVAKSRVGLYGEREVTGLSLDLLDKYFDRRGDSFEVKKSLRDRIIFARQDLIKSPPFVKLDLVVCRNVIIYFEANLQRKIFEIFNYALKPDGLLFLGKSEAIASATELFEVIEKKNKIFRRITTKHRQLPSSVRASAPAIDPTLPKRRLLNAPSALQIAQAQVLERYGIAGALVNGEGTIETIIGDVSAYLKIPAGLDNFKIQALLPKGAAVEFQLLLRKAAKLQTLQVSRPFKTSHFETSKQLFQIQVSPAASREAASSMSEALLLVSFDKVSAGQVSATNPTSSDADLELRSAELEQELAATKEHLQTVIEELGVTNEELQSSNEELSSTNEELQSSNEELETTNEEFQSTNEELNTVNEELNAKSRELRFAYTDLENIQVSIAVPMLVVDESLRLQRFNPSTSELFDIGATDLGRTLSKLSSRCEIEGFSSRVRTVVETGNVYEATVEGFRSVYQMRVTPRRTEDNKIIGAVILFFNNTELILTEQKLRKSERRMRGVIDGTSSLIFLKDMAGKYLSVNEAFLKYFSVKDADVLGRTDREIFNDEFAHQLRNGDLEAVLKRTRVEKQEEFKNRREKPATFLVSRFPLYEDDQDTTYGVGTVAVDITAQVDAKAALQKSEALYRGVVEDQTVFVMRLSPGGTVKFVNTAFLRFFGGAPLDYLEQPITKIVDLSDRLGLKDDLSRLSIEKPVVQIEHRYSKFESSPRWIRWIFKAVLDDSGNLSESQAVGFDVTESRQQTDQMVQREMLFSNIFTYTTDFLTVYRVTAAGELLLESFNRTVDDGGGYTYAQFLGRNVRDLVTSQHRAEILAKYRLCVETKSPQAFEEELSLQGAIKHLATTVIPVLNNSGVVERVVTLSRDISKYKIAEADLNAAKAAAEIANETKSDFLASMSHELRSPLNVVIGMSELLQEANLGKIERDQVKSIQRSGKVLLTLIEDILDISKIEAGKTKFEYSNFSLRELLDDVSEAFALQAQEKKIKIAILQSDDGIDHYVGDVNRIRQILTNFVSNAIKFTDKGSVSITVSSVGHKSQGRRLVRFDVKDTGIGIPEEFHSRIFKKFSQVDSGLGRRYGGSGLGLVISQRLTTLMHGQIGFSSEWSKGSNFWFELPLTIAKSVDRNEPRIATSAILGQKIKPVALSASILAVDDSPDSRLLLQMLLKRLGHQCHIVDSGLEAIEAVQKSSFDLVLMDVQMPGMDGYEATTRIRHLGGEYREIPIIALTANAMVGDSEKCFDAGMSDYVTKPINSDLLRGVILKWATKRPRPVAGAAVEG